MCRRKNSVIEDLTLSHTIYILWLNVSLLMDHCITDILDHTSWYNYSNHIIMSNKNKQSTHSYTLKDAEWKYNTLRPY